MPVDPAIIQLTQKIAASRPSYGTRRMAVMLSKSMGRPINRKQARRAFYALGWLKPSQKKSHTIRESARKPLKPTTPNQLWQTDMTYTWCGTDRWCYLFNVVDAFTRQWVGYSFDTAASKESAIQAVLNESSSSGADPQGLVLRVDNGSQYRSQRFVDSIKSLGMQIEFIAVHTPEQNGHVESFHRTLKKEYLRTHDFASYQQAEQAIRDAHLDYNQSRIHSALGYRTPDEFLKEWEMTNK
jgi:putative transposase